MQHKKYEQMARDEAKKSVCHERRVGCIIVNGAGSVMGRGHNKHEHCVCENPLTPFDETAGCPSSVVHAEAMAIEDAFYAEYGDACSEISGSEKFIKPYTLYFTQPPCNKILYLIRKTPEELTVHICEQFLKFDDDKLRYDLIPPEWETALAEVLTHGAKKYKSNNWQQGEVERYVAATMRHWNAYRRGETKDPHSGMPHLWHIFTNIGFLIHLEEHKVD